MAGETIACGTDHAARAQRRDELGLERAEKELCSLWILQGPPGCDGRVVG